MAYCITSQWASTAPQMKLTVVESSSNESTSTLSWTLQYIASSAASTSSTRDWSVSIAGEVVDNGSYSINGKTGTNLVASGTKAIAKTGSSQTISFSCTVRWALTWSGKYQGTSSASGSITVAPRTSYSITYDANGGSGAPSKQTKWYNIDLTLSSTKPIKSGYTFSKWNTEPGGNGASYTAGQTYTTNTSLYLYAQYTANTYTVSYDANGGTGAPANQTKTHGVTLTLSSTKPTRAKYTFKGWGTSASSTTVLYAAGASYTGNANITLYAIWELSYVSPVIENLSIQRCTSDGTLTESGTYLKITFDAYASAGIQTVTIKWAKENSNWQSTSYSPNVASVSHTGIVGDGEIVPESAYSVSVAVYDGIKTTTQYKTVTAAKPTMNVLPGGVGLAFGKMASLTNTMEVDYEGQFNKNLLVKGKLTTSVGAFTAALFDPKDQRIRNGLVAYESAGIDPDTTLEHEILTATNTPNGAFMYIITYFYSDKTDTSNRMQIAFPYNKKDGPYYRYYLNGTWSSWLRIGGHIYVTADSTDVWTGDLWLGKYPVYRRYVQEEVTTTATNVTIADPIDGFGEMLNMSGSFVKTSNGTCLPLQYYYSSSNYVMTWLLADGSVRVRCSEAGTATVVIDYVNYGITI